jgi:hypothetical protein
MKVFNGSKLLEDKGVSITFSNGKTAVVTEISDETLELINNLTDKSGAAPMRSIVESMCKFEEGALAAIGLVELKGAMDFLSESLFS